MRYTTLKDETVSCQPPQLAMLPMKPDRCNRPAEFMYRQCCIFPPFFLGKVAKDCGAMFQVTRMDKEHNVTSLRRTAPDTCEHWRCILKKYFLLNADDTLDDEKYYLHLDRWTELNPQFTNIMGNAKTYCKNTYRTFLPLEACDFYNMHICIRHFVVTDCPSVIPIPECIEQKIFYDECREFYI